nr:hypothetical protein [uncultured Rhodoferax sp.]
MQMSLPLEVSRSRGLAGMTLAEDNAEKCSPGWSEMALDKFRAYVATLPFDKDFIAEEARLAIQPELPETYELRAWGSVVLSAIRQGILAVTGRFRPAVSSHCSPKPVYRRGIGA